MFFIGHEEIRNRLKKSIKSGAPSHAHLIIGEDGIGKSLVAKEFALELLGKDINKDYIDIVKYDTQKASFGVDDVRDIISEAYKKPFEGDKKVIIISNGNKLTTQAQNALLKTIEEPPYGVYIIILCESGETILETIKSRCQIHKLNALSDREMTEYIKKYYPEMNYNIMKTSLAFAEGIPGKVDRFIGDKEFAETRNLVVDLLKDINDKDISIVTKYEEKLIKLKNKEDEFLTMMISFVRDVILFKELKKTSIMINGDKIDDIEYLANEMSYKKLNAIVDIVGETKSNLESNTNSVITLDVMLINCLEV